jgi:hypothetical protein
VTQVQQDHKDQLALLDQLVQQEPLVLQEHRVQLALQALQEQQDQQDQQVLLALKDHKVNKVFKV